MEEVIAAHYYVTLADEVTSHNTEHLAICARFVNKNIKMSEKSS